MLINIECIFYSKRCNCGLVLDINECEETDVLQQKQLHRCEWKCVNLPGAYICVCPRGYRLHPNGHQCEGMHMHIIK